MARRPTKVDSAYDDDELTDDERKVLAEHDASDELPPPDDSQQQQPGGDDDDDDQNAAPPPAPPPAPPAPAPDGDDGDDGFAEFSERHKGKSPEELARLAFQQNKRANRAEFDHRKLTETTNAALARIQERRDAKLAEIKGRREEFAKLVETDPDAALLRARQEQLDREEQGELSDAEAAEIDVRQTAAIELAANHIPDFAQTAGHLYAFGQEMGYSSEELGAIDDGRHLIMLHLARIAGNMMKAGLIDSRGHFMNLPAPTEDLVPPAQQQQQRRQPGFQRAPKRAAAPTTDIAKRLEEISNIEDEDEFEAAWDEAQKLMKQMN